MTNPLPKLELEGYGWAPESGKGVYSNLEIKRALAIGHIIIHPLVPEYIGGSSVDVTLGEHYYETEKDGEFGEVRFFNPYSQGEVKKYFGEPKVALPLAKHPLFSSLRAEQKENIPDNHPVIILPPQERILAHTHEFIGIKPPGTSSMQAKSTTGRVGISACLDAGWGDPGYVNRWTMEITNVNKRDAVPLPVGERIAQIVFYHTGEVEGEYSTLSGNYQSTSSQQDAETLVTNLVVAWDPEQMLPRAYKSGRRKPLPL